MMLILCENCATNGTIVSKIVDTLDTVFMNYFSYDATLEPHRCLASLSEPTVGENP